MTGMRKLALTAAVLSLIGVVAGASTWATFSKTTSNTGNNFEVGGVALTDNDADSTLLSLVDAMPGETTTGCIEVSYAGTLNANVKLFGTVSGALAQYLTLKVTRGTNTGSFPSCNFTPDTRDYIGEGAGVLYEGNLSSYPASYAAGITDPDNATGSAETWASPETHAYKLEVTLQNDSAAQGQSASASFTWEARDQ